MIKDKFAHIAEYLVLGALMFKAIRWRVTTSKLATFMLLLALGVTIGALDEIMQGYVPRRRMDPYDWWADLIGVAAGAGLFVLTRLGGGQSEKA